MHTFEYSFESNFGQEEGVAHLRTGRNMTSLPYNSGENSFWSDKAIKITLTNAYAYHLEAFWMAV